MLRLMPQNDPSLGQTEFVKQGAMIPQVTQLLQEAADADNAGYQAGVTAVDPSLTGNIAGVDEMARLYGLGAVSKDTREAINRQNAYNAYAGGFQAPVADATGAYGSGSSMMSANNAVLVGRQALEEQGMAPQLAASAGAASLALNPTHVNVGSTLLSPGALMERQDAANYYNNDLKNQFRLMNAAAQNKSDSDANASLFGGIGAGISSLTGGGMGSGGGGGGMGGMMGMMGGMMGGGGGG